MKKYYVILTGSKNNAGDFLIKYRAKELLNLERPDRDIIDIDGWEAFDEKKLEIVNGAEALILMGGPALQKNMYPGIYPLVEDLSKIKTKILMMGVGWKSLNGAWINTHNYELSDKTKVLLERVNKDGISSVRDYHTLNTLMMNGYNNVLMTGCPATYVHEYMSKPMVISSVKSVAFSLGVSFLQSHEMATQMKSAILECDNYFKTMNGSQYKFVVAFHHSTASDFLKTHNSTKGHLKGHQEFISWLERNNIIWKDISGSAENLIDFYSCFDLHIGYRVHAHIFMSSINKPSILLAEDGRGKALPLVFGGVVIDSFIKARNGLFQKILRKLKLNSGYLVSGCEKDELISTLSYEISNNWPRIRKVRNNIDDNYELMKCFLKRLP